MIHLSAGKTAERPYFYEKMQVNVFTLEELCFCICSSARFLDKNFPDRELIEWIENDIELPELCEALSLYDGRGNRKDTATCARIILDFAGLQSREEIGDIVASISESLSLSLEKKKLSAADHIFRHGRYHIARRLYDMLYESLPEEDLENRALCLSGAGKCYGMFFFYKEAADCFLKAYNLTKDKEDLIRYLSAMRLYLPDERYLDLLTEHPDYYEYSIESEKRIRNASQDYETSEDHKRLEKIMALSSFHSEDGDDRQKKLEEEVLSLKKDYREKSVWE
ncbi:MAG: hypothetical protein K6E33_08940 [Lachnospiraceae bacterium]|nr:hypothetical protein [Lachnospiraceae bacterium]